MTNDDWKQTPYFKENFSVLKSGEFKGMVSSAWYRTNSGTVLLTCPKCGGWISLSRAYDGKVPCSCGWTKDKAGFRYRWILESENNGN